MAESHESRSNRNARTRGTIPYRIVEAYEALLDRRIRPDPDALSNVVVDNAASCNHSTAPIDLVAVVASIACESKGFSDDKVAHLQLSDESLACKNTGGPPMAFYSFLLGKQYAVVGSSLILHTRVGVDCICSVGDIVRFNRISLREGHRHTKRTLTEQTTEASSSSLVIRFGHSWEDLENGQHFFRLCRFDPASGKMVRTDPDCIPCTHETDGKFLEHLMVWNRTKSRHFLNLRRQDTLAPFPRKHWSLEELQSCAGIYAYTPAVHVARVQTTTTTSSSKKWRKRRRPNTPWTFAILSDGVHHMSLLDPTSRIGPELQEAVRLKRSVHVGPIQTCRAAEIQCFESTGFTCGCGPEEMFLVCNVHTKVSFIGSREQLNSGQFKTQHQSQPSTSMEKLDYETSRHDAESSILAWIIDLSVNGTIVDGSGDPQELSRTLCVDSRKCFPAARILLGLRDKGLSDRRLTVLAKPDILQLLCGGVHWEQFQNQEAIRNRCVRFLLSLMGDRVPLRWDLQQGMHGDEPLVSSVRLEDLDVRHDK